MKSTTSKSLQHLLDTCATVAQKSTHSFLTLSSKRPGSETNSDDANGKKLQGKILRYRNSRKNDLLF